MAFNDISRNILLTSMMERRVFVGHVGAVEFQFQTDAMSTHYINRL